MRWDPDTEDSDINGCNDSDGAPFHLANRAAVLSDKGDTVDYDLHEKLDLEHPEEEDKEEDRDAKCFINRYSTPMSERAYVGPNFPWRNSHPMTPMIALTKISPHTM